MTSNNGTDSLVAAAVDEQPLAPADDSAAPGTGAAAARADDPLVPYSGNTISPAADMTFLLSTTTTTTTTLSAILNIGGGGGRTGGGSASSNAKGGGVNNGGDDVLPWILCFGIGLVVIWIGWMLRSYISRKCCGAEEQRSENNRNVHWQWISTGNPHSATLLPRHKGTHGNDPKVDLSEVDAGGFKILIGGDMTPGSGMTPIASQVMINPDHQQMGQQQLSKHDFNHLLGRVCCITDPTVKFQTFQLTFESIQLGCWTKDEWDKFTSKLLELHPKANQIVEDKSGYINKRSVLDEWLNWQTVEKADMRDIYEALAVADKMDVAHNAAISVTLELRAAAGRITSECVDVMSECSEQANNEELEILEEEDEEGEEELTPTNSVKAAFTPSRQHRQRQRSNHSNHRESQRLSESSSTIGFGVGREAGRGPEDRLLTNTSATLPRESESQLLQQQHQQHHSSSSPQHILNDSVGNETVHSTEKLIHV